MVLDDDFLGKDVENIGFGCGEQCLVGGLEPWNFMV
jgi:hypothetical protein